MHTRSIWALVGSVTACVLFNANIASAQVTELTPNLVARPASQLSIVVDSTNGHVLLRFDGTSWNNGLGPLELIAGGATDNGQDVYQRIYSSDGSYTDTYAGTFIYHPQHNHFHFGDFARYELAAATASPGSVQTSSKTSFCIMDTTAVDLSLPGAPHSPVYSTCNKVKQGMSVGWGDTYGPALAGQSFDITGLPEDDYTLTIISDPNNRLIETNETDNVACLRLHLNPAAMTLQALGTCGAVTVLSMTPNTIKQGTSMNVTISGSGFAAGMAVGFENGSGSAPSIRVTSVTATTIEAVVTVKKGGGKGERYWDLRVGAGVLYRALKITQ